MIKHLIYRSKGVQIKGIIIVKCNVYRQAKLGRQINTRLNSLIKDLESI
jgi:hypothetical protein